MKKLEALFKDAFPTINRGKNHSFHIIPFLTYLKKKSEKKNVENWLLVGPWTLGGASGQHRNRTFFLVLQFLLLDVNASCAFLKVIKGNEDTF